jgi:hypothetical protein
MAVPRLTCFLPSGGCTRPGTRWTSAWRRTEAHGPDGEFQETLRRLAIFDEGLAEAGLGPSLAEALALDAKTVALLQLAVWRYVYRAVDQYGQVIDILVSARRDAAAARRFFQRALATLKVVPAGPGRLRCRQYLHLGDACGLSRDHHDHQARRPYEATKGRGEPWPQHRAPAEW